MMRVLTVSEYWNAGTCAFGLEANSSFGCRAAHAPIVPSHDSKSQAVPLAHRLDTDHQPRQPAKTVVEKIDQEILLSVFSAHVRKSRVLIPRLLSEHFGCFGRLGVVYFWVSS